MIRPTTSVMLTMLLLGLGASATTQPTKTTFEALMKMVPKDHIGPKGETWTALQQQRYEQAFKAVVLHKVLSLPAGKIGSVRTEREGIRVDSQIDRVSSAGVVGHADFTLYLTSSDASEKLRDGQAIRVDGEVDDVRLNFRNTGPIGMQACDFILTMKNVSLH